MNFKVGDRVIIIQDSYGATIDMPNLLGQVGTIVEEDGSILAVKFTDEFMKTVNNNNKQEYFGYVNVNGQNKLTRWYYHYELDYAKKKKTNMEYGRN